jgi:hypothetical protein
MSIIAILRQQRQATVPTLVTLLGDNHHRQARGIGRIITIGYTYRLGAPIRTPNLRFVNSESDAPFRDSGPQERWGHLLIAKLSTLFE